MRKPRSLPLAVLTRRKSHTTENRCKTHLRGTLNQSEDKDQGWSLELAIPWQSLSKLAVQLPPADGARWRVQINRWDGTEPHRRLSMWGPSGLKRPNPHNPERFGKLIFK